jgi:tetratricopeptide (TPR) repeat protein
MTRSGQVKAVAALLYSGQVHEAIEACETVLSQYPKDDQMLAIHGQALAQARRHGDAIGSLLKAIRIEPRQCEYLTLLGETYMNSGRFHEALVQFDKALKLRGDYDPAVADKANTYLRMGKPKKAGRTIDQRLAIGPATPPIAVLQARVFTKLEDAESAIDALAPWLESPQLPVENQRSIHFALGDAHDKAKHYSDAFDAYQRANALAGQRWNLQEQEQLFTLITKAYGQSMMNALPTSRTDGSAHVFIVGMPRCGSTLTEQLIHCHPDAHGIGESECLPQLIQAIHQEQDADLVWPNGASEINADRLTTIAEHYVTHTVIHAGKARRIIDKQLGNYLFIGLIQQLLPGARIIHCQRHPMDMCLSGWTKQFPPGTNAWADDLDSAGQMYQLYDRLMNHWRDVCSIPILDIRYEDLVMDLEGSARSILEFCDLPWHPACLRFWENKRATLTLSNDQVRQPLYQSAKGRHAAWGGLLDPLRTALGDSIPHYEAHC